MIPHSYSHNFQWSPPLCKWSAVNKFSLNVLFTLLIWKRGVTFPRELLRFHGSFTFSNTHWKSFFPENFHFPHFENFSFFAFVTFFSSMTFDSETRATQRKRKHLNREKREIKIGGKSFLIFSFFNQFSAEKKSDWTFTKAIGTSTESREEKSNRKHETLAFPRM